MMSSLLAYLVLTAADPAAAAAPLASPAACAAVTRQSAATGGCPRGCKAMAIDEVGMPVDKKDKKKSKGNVASGPGDSDSDGDGACRAAAPACAAGAKVIVDTYGGHGAHGGSGIAISESGAHVAEQAAFHSNPAPSSSPVSCPAPAGMAINEKGTVGTPTKRPKSNK